MRKPESEQIIIGIDPGTIVTGYGIIKAKGSSYTAIDYGCIRPPAKEKISDRYLIIYNGLNEILAKYQPQSLIVETQYVAKNVQSTLKLGMSRGIAIIVAKKRQMNVFEYAPSKAKRAVVGNGKASKKQVQAMVQCLLGLSELPQPEDASDALALAICHAHMVHYHQSVNEEI